MKQNSKRKGSKAKIYNNEEWKKYKQEFDKRSYKDKIEFWESNNFFKWGEWEHTEYNPKAQKLPYKEIFEYIKNNNYELEISILPDQSNLDELKLFVTYVLRKYFEPDKPDEWIADLRDRMRNGNPEKVFNYEFALIEERTKNERVKKGYELRAIDGITQEKAYPHYYEVIISSPDERGVEELDEGFKLAEREFFLKQELKTLEMRKRNNLTIETNPITKLVWNGKKNQLADILFELKEKGFLKGSNDLITEWICNNFSGWENSREYILKILQKNINETDNRKPKPHKKIKLESVSKLSKK